jgi:hypothetical protein
MAALERDYLKVATNGRSPTWAIVALARIGQLAEYNTINPIGGDLPRMTASDEVFEPCRLVMWRAVDHRLHARAAYTHCLERSIATGTFTELSHVCDDALTDLEPRRFPPLAEIVGRAQYVQPARPEEPGLQLDPVPVQRHLSSW